MKRLAGAILILTLAACSKEPPPVVVSEKPAVPVVTALSPAAKPPDEPRRSSSSEGGQLKQGEEIFNTTCATCHMADGYGVPNLQPQIVGSGWISAPDPQLLLSLILRGSAILGEAAKAYDNDMAPQSHLTDEQVAAVATYVRQRFAAPPITKPVTPAEVAIARARPGLPQ